MENNRICIVGLGYVGLTLAMHAIRNRYEVHGIEILEDTYDIISSGSTHFHEPGLDELLKLSLGKNFFIHKDIPKNIDFDVFVITVGTPLVRGQKYPDMDVLENAIDSVTPFVSEDNLVILRSTIPVGTSRLIAKKFAETQKLSKANVSFCPERTAEGQALVELQSLPQIISGNCVEATDMARRFFEPLTDEVIEANSLEEAELIKLFNNTYRDASFAIANTFNQIAQSFNIDGAQAINKANHNYSRSSIPKPGFVAGPCLEKDAYILSSNMPEGDLKNFLMSIRSANESLEFHVSDFIKNFLSRNSCSKVLVSGLAFKGVPQTNDLRGSSSVNILSSLTQFSKNITIHDFMNSKKNLEERLELHSIEPEEIFEHTTSFYDLIIILNNHPNYKNIKMKQFIQEQINKGSQVVDSWGVMELPDQLTLSNLFIEES